MTHRILTTTALFACVLALAACKPAADTTTPGEPAAPDANTALQPATDAHPTDVISEVDNAVAPAGFDVKAFAGTFDGTIPCEGDCDGIGITVQLNPDGTYLVEEVVPGGADIDIKNDGTWTVEADGERIRLDPNSKDLQDQLYAVLSNDEISGIEKEDSAVDPAYNLKRASK